MKNLLTTFILVLLAFHSKAQISINNVANSYIQNFDSLSNDSVWSNSHNLNLDGWMIYESGNGAAADNLYKVNHGNKNTGETYSYGEILNMDRALGSISSATNIPSYGCVFENNTGNAIVAMVISFAGEQWRSADGIAGNDDSLVFEYSTNALGLDDTAATWQSVWNLLFITPNSNAVTGALNGNDSLNRTQLSDIIYVSIPGNGRIYLRWRDVNRTGTDDGLAIDDLSIQFIPVNVNKPLVVQLLPADETPHVPVMNTELKIIFDKAVTTGSGECKIYNITDGTTQTISFANCTSNVDTGIIAGVNLLANKEYSVQFDSTLYTTVGGNYNAYGLYDNFSWNFDTKFANSISDRIKPILSIVVSGLGSRENSELFVQSHFAGKVSLEILDLNGHKLFTQVILLKTGLNFLRIQHPSLSGGNYILRITGKGIHGSTTFSK